MDRSQFEHVIAAAANVVEDDEIVVIGSQAILGSRPDAPPALLRSMEADVFPRRNPDQAIEIDGAIGDGSPFHETFGYYAHGVGPETVVAPSGWQGRLVAVEVPPRPGSERGAIARCLEPHDLVLAKCARGLDRDWEFAVEALRAELVAKDELLQRIDDLPVDQADQVRIRRHIDAM